MIYDNQIDNELRQCDIFSPSIFKSTGQEYFSVILNPNCDLVIQEGKKKAKAEFIKLAAIIPIDDILENILSLVKITKRQRSGLDYIDNDTYNDLIKVIKAFMRGDMFTRFYYLPPLKGYFSHSIIDYQLLDIRVFNTESEKDLKDRKITGILSSWRESIPVRYSDYSSRIGVEDITDDCIDSIFTDFNLNFSRSS